MPAKHDSYKFRIHPRGHCLQALVLSLRCDCKISRLKTEILPAAWEAARTPNHRWHIRVRSVYGFKQYDLDYGHIICIRW